MSAGTDTVNALMQYARAAAKSGTGAQVEAPEHGRWVHATIGTGKTVTKVTIAAKDGQVLAKAFSGTQEEVNKEQMAWLEETIR